MTPDTFTKLATDRVDALPAEEIGKRLQEAHDRIENAEPYPDEPLPDRWEQVEWVSRRMWCAVMELDCWLKTCTLSQDDRQILERCLAVLRENARDLRDAVEAIRP